MDRRNAIRLLGLAGLGAMSTESLRGQTLAPYTVGGAAPVLIAFDRGTGHYDQLIERYRVVVIDYPPAAIRDATTASVIESFSPDRVCIYVIAGADAVGADSFAY